MTSAEMIEVTLRPREPEDDERIVDINNRIEDEFPPGTVEQYRHRLANAPKDLRQERWVAVNEDRVVGSCGLFEMRVNTPNTFYVRLSVDPGLWGHGIGSQIHDHLMSRAAAVEARQLYSEVRGDHRQAREFAARRGFKETGRAQRMSRLEVKKANLTGYEGVEDRLRQEGLRIATLAEIGTDDDEFMHAFYDMFFTSGRDIPTTEEWTPPPYDEWLQHLLDSPGKSPERVWIALDGKRPVGVAELGVFPGTNAADNDYTGVDREYRGRGVARALKLRTINWCRENGIEYIYTGNDMENKRMLSINIPLGYEAMEPYLEVVKEMDT